VTTTSSRRRSPRSSRCCSAVTTILEPGTVAHPLRVADGLATAGIRGRVGRWGWDVDGVPFSAPVDEVLARQEETVKALPAGTSSEGWGDPRRATTSPATNCSPGPPSWHERLDVGLTLHMSPGEGDVRAYAVRSGRRPIVHLERLGGALARLVLGHAVWLDDAELEAVLAADAAIASCPGAYLRLGQGYARAGRHGEFVRRGGRLALGGDAHNAGDSPGRVAYSLAAEPP